MLIRNVSLTDLEMALGDTNDAFENNVIWNRSPEPVGKGFRLTLRVKDSKGAGARRSHTGRRLVSACWHVHGTFFDALPEKAVIRTSDSITHPNDEWQDRNIGSMFQPLMHSDACECGHTVHFSKVEMVGDALKTLNVRTLKQSDLMKCPFCIIMPDHYRADGTCKCDDARHRKMMIKEWEYTEADFANIPLRKES